MNFTKKEYGYLYNLVLKDIDEINKKRTLPIDYADTAQSVELKLSAKCKQLSQVNY